MDLYPAIDLRGGQVVRLAQGEAQRQTVYGDDPVAQALIFADAGARWIHLVDLDRAFGRGDNDAVIAAVARAVEGRARLQVGGGVRSFARAAALIEQGVTRVVMGTAAVEQPEIVDAIVMELGSARLAVGIDARAGRVALRGWVDDSELTASVLAARVAAQGVRTVIYTDIARDGMLGGPDVDGSVALRDAMDTVDAPEVIVSGGIATIADLLEIAARGLGGAIVGRALYEGRFTLLDALEATAAA